MEGKTSKLKKKATNFKDILRDFSLHNMTKPKAQLKSVTHFDSLHRISDLDSDYANTLKLAITGKKMNAARAPR
jgi:hypothetical protein